MPKGGKLVRTGDLSLSGLHSQFEPSPWIHASDVAELYLLRSRTGQKLLLLPIIHLVALQRAIRKVGRALYAHNIPHFIVSCRPHSTCSLKYQIELRVAVPDPQAAFDLLRAAGFEPHPMYALTVTSRCGLVCFRLSQP